MTASLGKNTIQGKRLLEIVEISEQYIAQKKEISDLNSALMAAAKAEGFDPKFIRYVIRARSMKPHDRQEAETTRDLYMHAAGMDDEPPMFRLLGGLAEDGLTREALLETFKKLAPLEGDIILRVGGQPVRIYRDLEGNPQVEPHVEKEAQPKPGAPKGSPFTPRVQREVPDVDEDGAEEHGRQMSRDNRPIIDNPFPFGDPRRARCDEGWRRENGGDGMGDDDEGED